jgi:hypothetical protein
VVLVPAAVVVVLALLAATVLLLPTVAQAAMAQRTPLQAHQSLTPVVVAVVLTRLAVLVGSVELAVEAPEAPDQVPVTASTARTVWVAAAAVVVV